MENSENIFDLLRGAGDRPLHSPKIRLIFIIEGVVHLIQESGLEWKDSLDIVPFPTENIRYPAAKAINRLILARLSSEDPDYGGWLDAYGEDTINQYVDFIFHLFCQNWIKKKKEEKDENNG